MHASEILRYRVAAIEYNVSQEVAVLNKGPRRTDRWGN